MFSLKSLKILSTLLVFAFLIVSCTKENIDKTDVKEGEIDPTKTEVNKLFNRSTSNSATAGLDFDCITVLYPFDLLDDQGGTHIVNSDQDFEALFDSTNLDVIIIDFVYPVTVEDEDGNTIDIATSEELGLLFVNCLPNGWDQNNFPAYLINSNNSCFELEYPINLVNESGITAIAANESEFIDLIESDLYFFVFPFDMLDETANTVTVADVDALILTLTSCNPYPIDTTYWNNGFDFIGCYMFDFPIDIVLTDGSIVTATNHMEYCDILLTGNMAGFGYPLELTAEDGTTLTVNSDTELQEALDLCGPTVVIEYGDIIVLYTGTQTDSTGVTAFCFDIVYPIMATEFDSLNEPTGNIITINDSAELDAAIFNNAGNTYNTVFPVSLILTDNNETVNVLTIEDVFTILFDCN